MDALNSTLAPASSQPSNSAAADYLAPPSYEQVLQEDRDVTEDQHKDDVPPAGRRRWRSQSMQGERIGLVLSLKNEREDLQQEEEPKQVQQQEIGQEEQTSTKRARQSLWRSRITKDGRIGLLLAKQGEQQQQQGEQVEVERQLHQVAETQVIACSSAQAAAVKRGPVPFSQIQLPQLEGEELEKAKDMFEKELRARGTIMTSVTTRSEWLAIPETDRDIIMSKVGRIIKCLQCEDEGRHYFRNRTKALEHVRANHFEHQKVFHKCPICKEVQFGCNTRNSFNKHVVTHGKQGYETPTLVNQKVKFYKSDDSHFQKYILNLRNVPWIKEKIHKVSKQKREEKKRANKAAKTAKKVLKRAKKN